MTAEPECPAPPCQNKVEFIAWCKDHRAEIAQLGFIHHERSLAQAGFFSRSHAVAYDEDGEPLQCAMLAWSEPTNLANAEGFGHKLRGYLGL